MIEKRLLPKSLFKISGYGEGQDLESSAQGSKPQALTLRATRQGDASPWIPIFWGWGRALAPAPYLAGTPCLADASRRDDRPPTHFFVKKKFSSACGAGAATQRGSSGLCSAHTQRGAGSSSHAGGSFFLYEKSVLRESDCLRGRRPEICTDLTPPLFRP